MKSLSNIDFSQNQALNLVEQVLSSAPGSPKIGQIFYNTTLNTSQQWNGTVWRSRDAAQLTDGSIQNSALQINPLNRTNHTGTQLSSTISDLAVVVKAYPLSSFAVPTLNIAMGGFTFTGLATPNAPGQAAEYSWVISQIQSAAAGIASKPPVAAVTTTNITLSGLSSIDGYTPVAGDRILVTGQTTASQNGVYNAASGAWTRTTIEGPAPGEIETGAMWMVQNGTTYSASQWRVATTGALVIGTTNLSIVQFGASSLYAAGNGLSLIGSTFAVVPVANGGIVSAPGGVSIDTTIVTRKLSATITGDGATLSFSVTHNLNTTDVMVQVFDSTGVQVLTDVTRSSTTTTAIGFSIAPTNGTTYRVIIVG